jgi:hypothetical protein
MAIAPAAAPARTRVRRVMGFSVIEGLPSRIVGLREPGSAWAWSAKVVFHAARSNHGEGKRSHDFVIDGTTTDVR